MKNNKLKPRIPVFGNLKTLVISALFVAISIVCGKYLAVPGGDFMRFSFENLPILLAGIAYGPIVGLLVGMLADIIGCLLVGYEINILIMLGAVTIGFSGGVLFRVCKRLPLVFRVLITVVASHIVGSVVVKSIAFSWSAVFKIYGMGIFGHLDWISPFGSALAIYIPWRSLNYFIVASLETVLIYALLNNKAVRKQLAVEL